MRRHEHQRWRHRAASRRPPSRKKWRRRESATHKTLPLFSCSGIVARPSFFRSSLSSLLLSRQRAHARTREAFTPPARSPRGEQREWRARTSKHSFLFRKDRKRNRRRRTTTTDSQCSPEISFFLFYSFLSSFHRAAAERAARREQERRKDEVRDLAERERERDNRTFEIRLFSHFFFRPLFVSSFFYLSQNFHTTHTDRRPSSSSGCTPPPPPASRPPRTPSGPAPASSAAPLSSATSASRPRCPRSPATRSSSSSPPPAARARWPGSR